MENINVDVRLRPIRFGFLVRPEDKSRVLQIFQINSCLWGGEYNPLIPFFQRVPAWWERKGIRFDNARQIVNGYLDFFEPDFLVEAEKGIAETFGVDPERVLQLQDILPGEGEETRNRVGLTVFSLFRKMYREEFQFVRRHEHRIVHVTASVADFKPFVGCIFGTFPTHRKHKYFAKGFKDAFDPKDVRLNAATLESLYRSGCAAPLVVGRAKLTADYHDRNDPLLFILDAHEARDLIDFWNYRAVHRDAIAIPIQWIGPLSGFCKEFITKNYRPLPNNNHGVMIRTTLMFSRSIPERNIENLYLTYLKADNPDAALLQTWYPPIWRTSPEFVVRTSRPTVEAHSVSSYASVDVEQPTIRFDSLSPEFADKYGGGEHRWANVVRLKDWSYKDRIATSFPCDFRKPAVPRFQTGLSHLISTTEGLVTFPRFKDLPNSWSLMDGSAAIDLWFKENKIESQLSESGRATEQIVQTLSGFGGVRAIASKGIVNLLNDMSRSPITRSAHRHEFQNKITAAVGKNIWLNRVFETLVERNAVELGYELKCPKCGSWSWYSVAQLDTTITCDLCLRKFAFPATDPSNSKHARWAYRVIGPFALPDYAKGGYASALAMRFFSDVVGSMDHSGVTWASGRNLTLPGGVKIEADFTLWYQRKQMFGTDLPTEIVFGEAKSFGKDVIKDDDINRLKSLAIAFPGAILVLATMKDATELTRDELKRIRRLAEWGRDYDRDRRQSRAPVLVLTGTELFTPHWLQQQWKEKGGKHAQLIEPAYVSVRLDNLRILADLTQQLYLEMPSYGAWRQTQWAKKRKRRKAAPPGAH
ncbi:MAG: hypothetical protein ABSD74_17095 [Rhizomicrobium sp.]|jgi:hypothetical protein